MDWEVLIPLVFLSLMGLAFLIYAALDGYDLGVGILTAFANTEERNTMIASIGPFWDANETWLVLGVGLVLVAFPQAHGMVLSSLYLPTALMLFGLILRGVAFDFRTKAHVDYIETWDLAFRFGSLLTSTTQGYMIGQFVLGLENSFAAIIFGLVSAFCITATYAHIGATWLVYKTEGELQRKSIIWARKSLFIMLFGILLVSIVNPLISNRVFERWFDLDKIWYVSLMPLLAFGAMAYSSITLNRLKHRRSARELTPFLCSIVTIVISAIGLGYSFFPYVVPGRLTVWEAAASHESLMIIFWGAIVVVPIIVVYTVYSYYVFRGKAVDLRYD